MKKTLFLLLLSFVCCCLAFAQKPKRKPKSTSRDKSENAYLKSETAMIDAQRHMILENYAEAYNLFLIALKLNPENPAVHYKLAEVLLKDGDPEEALPHAQKAKAMDPDNKYYYLMSGQALQKLGRIGEAAALYEEMIERIPGTGRYLYELGLFYQFQNEYDKALATYERLEHLFGISESILEEKQKIYLKTGDTASLINEWNKLIEANPGEHLYVFKLAEILVLNNKLDLAREKVLELKERASYLPQIDLVLGDIERRRGNYLVALDLLAKPIESDEITVPDKLKLLGGFLTHAETDEVKSGLVMLTNHLTQKHPDNYQAQAFAGDVLYEIGEKDKAIEHYLKAIELRPGNFSVWQTTINLEFELHEYDSVIVHSERALEYFPNQAIFYFFNGVGHYIQHNYRHSIEALEAGKNLTTDPSLLSEFYGQLGDAFNGLEDHRKSDEAYDKSLELNPENHHALNNYSYFLSLRKAKLDKAKSMSRVLIKTHPDNPTYLDTHGWVLFTLGDYEEAEKFLKRAAELGGENGTILEHYGDVLFRLGDVSEAVAQWQKAKAAGGASGDIEQKINERRIK